jgi:DNA-binding transcriptional LysR family regulator
MSFDWNHAKAFVAVVDEGSLSAAARVLGQTQPTVSRQILALEEALNVTLFERTGRSVHLTPSGLELLDHVRAMAAGANMVALSASGQSQSIDGQIRITASEVMSAYILPDILDALSETAPRLNIELVADNTMRDITRREADIAVRHSRPDQPSLIARRVRDHKMRFYASAAYIAQHGTPMPADLSRHQILTYADVDQMIGYLTPVGLTVTRAQFRLSTSSQCVACEMARRGKGIIILPEQVASNLPELKGVLDDVAPFSIPTWLVTHSELHTSRRIRLVFDHLAAHL